MQVDIETGLLDVAQQVASPNCDDRPAGEAIELVVIHNISLPPGEFGGGYIDQLFTNRLDCTVHPYFETLRETRVSSHLLIARTGDLAQYVPFQRRAWHAGESTFQGRTCCNDFSIGIELEGTDDVPFSDDQYPILVQVVRALFAAYPSITQDAIVGHCDIAPERKTDPGPAFDWQRLHTGLAEVAVG